MARSSRSRHCGRNWAPRPNLSQLCACGRWGGGAGGDSSQQNRPSHREQSLPDGCLKTRNAPSGQGSDRVQLLTAQGLHCRSEGGTETEVHLEEKRERSQKAGAPHWPGSVPQVQGQGNRPIQLVGAITRCECW